MRRFDCIVDAPLISFDFSYTEVGKELTDHLIWGRLKKLMNRWIKTTNSFLKNILIITVFINPDTAFPIEPQQQSLQLRTQMPVWTSWSTKGRLQGREQNCDAVKPMH
jgi:hypothetical protein